MARHRSEMEAWTEPFRKRRKLGGSHPIHDFLFVYYRLPPSKLKQWHPGVEQNLLVTHSTPLPAWFHHGRYSRVPNQASETRSSYPEILFCDPAKISATEKERLEFILDMIGNTQHRKPNFSCFGMHEWAMVYRGKEVRHEATTPLRLPQNEIDAIVESKPIHCSHFDAFRFFAIDAKPLNKLQPTLEGRLDQEQPACIHANMDLYKWAFKSMPWIGTELLTKCFKLALAARDVDMRASPYDLTTYGNFVPIKVETSQGRLEYQKAQRDIYERALPLRAELMRRLNNVISICQETA